MVEDPMPVDRRGEESLDVFHDENGRMQPVDDPDVLSIEEVPVVVGRIVISDAAIPGASNE
jgi:hypothetical protein